MAMTLNGRKKHLNRNDFLKAAATHKIDDAIVEKLFKKYQRLMPKFESTIDNSFMGAELKEAYKTLLHNRLDRLK